MAYGEGLATRSERCSAIGPGLAEKQLFGGLTFPVDGKMACGVRGENLIMRVATAEAEAALGEPGARHSICRIGR